MFELGDSVVVDNFEESLYASDNIKTFVFGVSTKPLSGENWYYLKDVRGMNASNPFARTREDTILRYCRILLIERDV